MIFNFGNYEFKDLMREDFLELPREWSGYDFDTELSDLYSKYLDKVKNLLNEDAEIKIIKYICEHIKKAVYYYFRGFPSYAYNSIDRAMKVLINNPLRIYNKTGNVVIDADKLNLYRARKLSEADVLTRKQIFHVPYKLRSKVASYRYSIAGFPSLYLSTNLELCCKESNIDLFNDISIASKFKLERDESANGKKKIRVLEIAIKPSDFLLNYPELRVLDNQRHNQKRVIGIDLNDHEIQSNYLLWYPLIAACSYIRKNRNEPFSPEYIVPQIVMQWIRRRFRANNELFGIRYFSCASKDSSEIGFNYVFPVSGERGLDPDFCPILTHAFKLTKPVYINDYITIDHCEFDLFRNIDRLAGITA